MNREPKTATVKIRRNRTTWAADVYWSDGTKWTSWCHNYPNKAKLINHIENFDCVTNIMVDGE